MSPDAKLKCLKFGRNAYDSELISIVEALIEKDSVVWDIGANVGVFTFACSSVANEGTVVCVEADAWLANLLRKTQLLSTYAYRDIRILSCAISDVDGVSKFNIAKRGRASNSLEGVVPRASQGGVREVNYVTTLSADTLLKFVPAPGFVKVDIEGAERLFVAGANQLINSIRPIFYIEVGDDSAFLTERFKSADYLVVHVGAAKPLGATLQNLFLYQKKNKGKSK